MQKLLSICVLATCIVAFFPVAWRLADPLFSLPFPKEPVDLPVLLVWPDHVQIRMFRDLSQISPIPKNAGYTFSVEPSRQAWVEAAVRATPSLRPDRSSWVIRTTQMSPGLQKIDLELLGDGIYGITYKARSNEIVPLKWRLTGPGGASIVFAIDFGLSVVTWGSYQFARHRLRRRAKSRIV